MNQKSLADELRDEEELSRRRFVHATRPKGPMSADEAQRLHERMAGGMTSPKSQLYRCKYLNYLGYVVYRYCFDETKCTLEEGVRAHKQAVFVDEVSAMDYCRYRNRMVDENGTDELPTM